MYLLMILDGWGISSETQGNAISQAATPNIDRWMNEYPNTTLEACCQFVGLPKGQMGNSEVGHLNIGAGRVILSPFMRLNNAIENGDFRKNKVLGDAIRTAKENRRPIHFVGMVSDGGVHSHINHLFALVEMAAAAGVRTSVHVILDGRDTAPKVAEKYIQTLEDKLDELGCGRISDISGRYYSMDRDKRWDRIEKGYNSMVRGEGKRADSAVEGLKNAYERGEGDEFVSPTVIIPNDESVMVNDLIQEEDSVIFFNFRPDRARQLSHAFSDKEFKEFDRKEIKPNLITMMKYEEGLNAEIAFPPVFHKNVLGEVLANHGKKQLRITETEKFAHVTFFLNGGREKPFTGEKRIMLPSPKVATYDLKPEMRAFGIVDSLIPELDNFDVVIMNFANCDMVGHTGIMDAAVKAVETVDKCAGKVVNEVLKRKGTIFITADHGNAELTEDKKGNPLTAHSLNPVPFLWISDEAKKFNGTLRKGAITDIAPTILKLMNIPVPKDMTEKTIIPEEYIS